MKEKKYLLGFSFSKVYCDHSTTLEEVFLKISGALSDTENHTPQKLESVVLPEAKEDSKLVTQDPPKKEEVIVVVSDEEDDNEDEGEYVFKGSEV